MRRLPTIIHPGMVRVTGALQAQREADEAFQKLKAKSKAKRRAARRNSPSDDAFASMKPICNEVLEWIPLGRVEAAQHGVEIDHRIIRSRKRQTLHVLFRDKRRRVVMQWWPATGKAIVCGLPHFATTKEAALAIAVRAVQTK